jgi:ParB/RepB/Spo0J family partition protein
VHVKSHCENPTTPENQPLSSSLQNGSGNTSHASSHTSPSPPTTTAPSPSHTQKCATRQHSHAIVPLHLIDQEDPDNGRAYVDQARVTSLANSIAAIGLTNPITLRPAGHRFTITAGNNRFLAAKKLGWNTIPAHVIDDDDRNSALRRLSENVTRSNLSPVEEALQLATLVEQHPDGTIGLADALGRTQAWIEDRLAILTWPANLIEHLHARRIKLGAAKHLAQIPDPATRDSFIRDAAQNGITANTARLWKAHAMSELAAQNDLPLPALGAPDQKTITHTLVHCFTCREYKPIEDTAPARVCSACRLELGLSPTDTLLASTQVTQHTEQQPPAQVDNQPPTTTTPPHQLNAPQHTPHGPPPAYEPQRTYQTPGPPPTP